MNKRRKLTLIIIVFFILATLWLQSTAWFRLNLAQFYKKHHNYEETIDTYEKILRKNNVTQDSNIDRSIIVEKIEDGYREGMKFYVNKMGMYSKPKRIDYSYFKRSYDKYKGLLTRYKGLAENYNQVSYEKGIVTKLNNRVENYSFDFGKSLIKKKDWKETKLYFTKNILHFISPLKALREYKKIFGNRKKNNIKERIWGKDNIYVIIEDFENKPVLGNYSWSGEKPKTLGHRLSNIAIEGGHSELLEVNLERNDYDCRGYDLNMPLINGLDFGINILTKKLEGDLNVSVQIKVLDKRDNASIWVSSKETIQMKNGWIRHEIKNINSILRNKKDTFDNNRYKLDRMLVCIRGGRGELLIDNMQLFL